jgi:hypothetical protein
MNIAEILKDCPSGTRLYSPIYGELSLEIVQSFDERCYPIHCRIIKNGNVVSFTKDGRSYSLDAEPTLFPSKNQRDWNKFRVNDQVDKLEEHGHIITKKDKNNMIQTKYKRIPFNIELAKKITNKEVKGSIVTRNGLKVRIICFNRKERKDIFDPLRNIVALIQYKVGDENGDEGVLTFRNNGMYLLNEETDYDLLIEIPKYSEYSNFEPQKWQSCIVRDFSSDKWKVSVCSGKDDNGIPIFCSVYSDGYCCHYGHFLPLSKITVKLIGTNKSYEDLCKELEENNTNK